MKNLTSKPWFKFYDRCEARCGFLEGDCCDDMKKWLMRESPSIFPFPPGTTRTDLHIWTPDGVEIGAMEPIAPYAENGRVFRVTVDTVTMVKKREEEKGEKDVHVIVPCSAKELELLLDSYGISTDKWRANVTALYNQMTNGKYHMFVENNTLKLKVDTVHVRYFYLDTNRTMFQLAEKKQVLKNGDERYDVIPYVAERCRPDEHPEDTARRALGVASWWSTTTTNTMNIPTVLHDSHLNTTKTYAPLHYTSLQCDYRFFNFSVHLTHEQWQLEYTKAGPDKTTHYSWQTVSL